MARLGAKVSWSEVSSILKNTFSVGICWWNRPHTSFMGLISYMLRSGAKMFRTKTLLNFASKALSNSFFQKTRFSVWIFVLNRTSPIFLVKRTTWHDWGQKCPGVKLRPTQKTVFDWNFFMKPAPYLFSRPNSLYGAFGGKIIPDENFAQFCLKSPLVFVFPKNTFSVWIFVLNRTSPIFLVKRTTRHDWGQKCPGVKLRPSQKTVFDWNFLMKPAPYLFSGPNWLYSAFGGKIVVDENFSQFCFKSPLEFVFLKKHVFGLNFCTKSHLTYFLG